MVIGSIVQSIASLEAGGAQEDAARDAQSTIRQNFLDGLSLIEPSMESGDRARSALEFELGLGERPVFTPDADEIVAPPEIVTIPGGPVRDDGWGMQGDPGYREPSIVGFDVDRFAVGDRSFTTRAAADDHLNELLAVREAENPGFEYRGFEYTPGFEFQREEGLKGIDRQFAARGGFDSGAAIRSAMRYDNGLRQQEYNNYLNRLGSMAGQGQIATQNAFGGFQNQGSQLANLQLQGGNARASSYMGAANGVSQGIQNGVAAFSMFGGGGMGGMMGGLGGMMGG